MTRPFAVALLGLTLATAACKSAPPTEFVNRSGKSLTPDSSR